MTLLDDPAEAARRLALLGAPHVAPLEALRARIVAAAGRAVPHVDPLDGGVGARLLLLLETPGPMAALGQGFVSADNATPTGRNLRRFLAAAGIAREELLIWNVVPWVVHAPGARNRPVRGHEVAAGLRWLPPLLALLPRLRGAVLAGKPAGRAAAALAAARPDAALLAMPHPSPVICCTDPAVPARIADTLARAARLLEGARA